MTGIGRIHFGLGQTTQDYLSLISQYESNNQNVPNYKYGPGYTAQGYYQITQTNWLNIAPKLGIDTSVYPNAMSAPEDVQAQVATYLLTETPAGISNWSNYNPQLMGALNSAGLQTSGAIVDVSGDGAAASTQSIMDSLTASAGIDVTNPTTDLFLLAAAGAAVLLIGRIV
jgi:hypothetical protein